MISQWNIYIYILIIVTQIGKVFVTFILCLIKIAKNLFDGSLTKETAKV